MIGRSKIPPRFPGESDAAFCRRLAAAAEEQARQRRRRSGITWAIIAVAAILAAIAVSVGVK